MLKSLAVIFRKVGLSTESHRALRFRCAKTSRRFIVVFYRASSAMRYVVVNVVDESEFAPKNPTLKKKLNSARQIEEPTDRPRKALPSLLTSALLPVQRLFGKWSAPEQAVEKAPPKQTTKTKASESREQRTPPPPPGGNPGDVFNIEEFNFNGWYCPCCGYGKDEPVEFRFVRCGRCNEYVCGARVRRMPDGKIFFRCHDKCGHSGILGEGKIGAMVGMGLDEKKPALLKDLASRQLNAGISAGPRALPSGTEEEKDS